MNALTTPRPVRPPTAVPTVVEHGLRYLPTNPARLLVELPDRAALLAECRLVTAATVAADPAAFAVQVERLALHYPENRLSREEQVVLLRDWRRLLGHLPLDILAASVDLYILSPARFFPTPGQFNEIADGMWRLRKMLADRAREVLAIVEGGR